MQRVFVERTIDNSSWDLLNAYYVPGSVLSDLCSLWQTNLTTALREELLSSFSKEEAISPPRTPVMQLYVGAAGPQPRSVLLCGPQARGASPSVRLPPACGPCPGTPQAASPLRLLPQTISIIALVPFDRVLPMRKGAWMLCKAMLCGVHAAPP